MRNDIVFGNMPYEYYCWLLENLENYIQTFCGKDRRGLFGCLKGKVTVSSDCFTTLLN